MFRTPIPNADLSRLESFGSEQLLQIFGSFLKAGPGRANFGQLSDAWGTLFSDLYLSAEELVDEMQSGAHRISGEDERMLQEFIRTDCANGGFFVLNVIKKGGKIDRAALIMIADLEDLAGLEFSGTTAIHLLADACDKGVRPALLTRAGKRLLSSVYDSRGIPVIFTLFALGDLSIHDLNAIENVFSEDELKTVMCRNRTGKNALTVFSEISMSLKRRPSLDRHTFFKTPSVKDTDIQNKS